MLILDIQHVGRPGSREGDLGAGPADVDGDGVAELHEREALLTPGYAAAATQQLALAGLPSAVLALGEYSCRHDRARTLAVGYKRPAYAACHLNAGGGRYGLVLHLPGSPRARTLAEAIASQLATSCPQLERVRVEAAAGSWSRAATTLAGLAGVDDELAAVCLEPAFMDSPSHRSLLTCDGLGRIGAAVATGYQLWRSASW